MSELNTHFTIPPNVLTPPLSTASAGSNSDTRREFPFPPMGMTPDHHCSSVFNPPGTGSTLPPCVTCPDTPPVLPSRSTASSSMEAAYADGYPGDTRIACSDDRNTAPPTQLGRPNIYDASSKAPSQASDDPGIGSQSRSGGGTMDSTARHHWKEWFDRARTRQSPALLKLPKLPELPWEAYSDARYDHVCGIYPKGMGTSEGSRWDYNGNSVGGSRCGVQG